MASASVPTASRFPVAFCYRCAKTVVTFVRIDAGGSEHRLCAHCDASLDGLIEWIGAAELESTGYEIGRSRTRANGGCGCGSGGSCSIRKT